MGKIATIYPEADTPLMTQYHAIKAQYQDAILFFRMGDFYEMFYEDAQIASKVLGLTLTSRGHGKAGEVPLAGFPYHALEGYLVKMIRAGYKVAICDQVEDPKLAKGIVKREVVQVVTPGTLTEEVLLESKRNNFLSAIRIEQNQCGMASVDVSTGEFFLTEFSKEKLPEMVQSIGPAEILIAEDQFETVRQDLAQQGISSFFTKREPWLFNFTTGYEILTRHFGTTSLKGFGIEDMRLGIGCAGAVIRYLQETQKTALSHIRSARRYFDTDYMLLDSATRRNLEIAESWGDNQKATLLSILDKTETPMGGRTLSGWLFRPLLRLQPIRERLNAVEELFTHRDLRKAVRQWLKGMGDSERIITRVISGKANPRELVALKRTLERMGHIQKVLEKASAPLLTEIREHLSPCEAVTERIEKALVEDPPVVLSEGGVFKQGYHAELDELRHLAVSGKEWIARFQQSERQRTGIPSLKVGYNQVFGYYIEVTKPHLAKIPKDYIRKQTLVNGERFVTPELKEMEEKILHAEEKILELEVKLFQELREFVAQFGEAIQENSRRIGELDALASLAEVAEEYRYVKPEVHEGDTIEIEEGRHPVVERFLPPGETFIPNDVRLDPEENQILIITGPNMAGKSTYLRQVGLIVLLAQVGSFVPAKKARIGLVDRIFTRVGAQDNITRGESTFLIEMQETASILHNATPQSLILLDEIGRGTSTFDGLSIAWAVAEYLHTHPEKKAKTLFATHYHELTELALLFPRIKNYNVAVKEWADHIIFLRKIVPGGCDHSYGIHVARLAGLPQEVIERAKEILSNLEANALTPYHTPKLAWTEKKTLKVAQMPPQLDLFSVRESQILETLKKLDINTLTPLEALKILDELKRMASEDKTH